jgi:broad specificity phosphatase PhoE
MRAKDKVAYRYPRGESYLDVIARVEPMIIEMERHREPLLIIGHQAVLRIVIAFYEGKSRAEAPHISIPLNTVIQLDPSVFKCEVTRHVLYEPPAEVSLDGQDEPQAPDFNVNDPPSH